MTPDVGVLLQPPVRLPAGDRCASTTTVAGTATVPTKLPNIGKNTTFPGAVRGTTDTVNVSGGGGG